MAGYLGPKAIQYNVDNSNVTNDSNVGGDLTVGGNLLVGTTDTDPANSNVNGTAIGAANYLSMTRTNGASMILNRKSSDGDIALFRKDGSTVGSIGTSGGQLVIGTGNTGLRFQNSIPAVIPRTTSDGASDGVFDLGDDNARFKDLYLSGGVVFGTGGPSPITSNTLDDYEEGLWTPYWDSTGATFSYKEQFGNYVKVGNMVHAQLYLRATASGSLNSAVTVSGFPFISTYLDPYNQWGGAVWVQNDINSTLLKPANNTVAYLYKNKSGTPAISNAAELNDAYCVGSVSYRTE
jgi:hypothetical protein